MTCTCVETECFSCPVHYAPVPYDQRGNTDLVLGLAGSDPQEKGDLRELSASKATRPSTNRAGHPAPYSKAILAHLRMALAIEPLGESGQLHVLDPFAGTGRIHDLEALFMTGTVVTHAVEIQKRWADMHARTICADSILWALDWSLQGGPEFDVIATSVVYPNGVADPYVGEGKTPRNTYASHLGELPAEGSSAGLGRWSSKTARQAHMEFNERAWAALIPILKPGGLLLLNTKDPTWSLGGKNHVGGFTAWLWRHLAEAHGLILQGFDVIPTRGLPQGANHTQRTGFEYLLHLRKPS